MDDDVRLNIGTGPSRVNAPLHLPHRERDASPEYIEISSSSSFDNGEDDNLAQLDPALNPLTQQQFSSEAKPRHQPWSLSTPDQMANRSIPPAQYGFDHPAGEPAAGNLLAQQNPVIESGEAYLNNNFENFDDLDIRDMDLARLMEEQFLAEMTAARNHDGGDEFPGDQQMDWQPPVAIDSKAECLAQVQAVFPDICAQYVSVLYDTVSNQAEGLVAHIVENVDKGTSYPKSRDTKKTQKRKRELGEDEEAALKYTAVDRPPNTEPLLQRDIRTILAVEFPETPVAFIDACLRQNGHRMFSTYRILEEAERTYTLENPPYNRIKTKRKMPVEYQGDNLTELINSDSNNERHSMLREFQAARRLRRNAEAKREEERLLDLAEQANLEKAQADGTMAECQCCFGDYPMNRMVSCDNEESYHMFCKGCAKQNAETVIGQSKYELVCMAMEGCKASFSKKQQDQFLDKKTLIALERNLLEANLRMAGIEDLASCPFCPNAAQYPPIEVDKEFRCDSEDCGKVSCRLCKLESHVPKSCEEHSKELGLSVRRQIEEAMSEALIRKCNKCGTPFVKEEGCNKMTCTRPGCRNVQCYVCSKSCSYAHFNDEARGGKAGNCPLFEKTSQRHEDEVKKAEQEALKRIRTEHPEYTEEDLTVRVSKAVMEDEQRRQAREAGPPVPQGHLFRVAAVPVQMPHNMANAINPGGAGARGQEWNNFIGVQPEPYPRGLLDNNFVDLREGNGPGNEANDGGVHAKQNLFNEASIEPHGLFAATGAGAPVNQHHGPGAIANAAPAAFVFNPNLEVHRRVNQHYALNGHAQPIDIVQNPIRPIGLDHEVRPGMNYQAPQANVQIGAGNAGIGHKPTPGIFDIGIARENWNGDQAGIPNAPRWPAFNADNLMARPNRPAFIQHAAALMRRQPEQ